MISLENFIVLIDIIFRCLGFVAGFLFLWWFLHPDSFERIFIHILRIAAFISRSHAKRYISKYIENKVSSGLKDVEKRLGVTLRHVKIK